MAPPDLRPLLMPRSIAVIGASTQAHKLGGMPIRLLREGGYRGAIYPVHLHADEIPRAEGLPVDGGDRRGGRSRDHRGAGVGLRSDAAAAGREPARAPRSCSARASPRPARPAQGLQRRLAGIASAHGIALLGPNCLGAMNLREHVYATFSPVVLGGVPPHGNISLVSQSGAFGGYAFALAREAQVGLRHWITTGNEAGIQVADAIHWLAGDAETGVILAYIEGSRDMPAPAGRAHCRAGRGQAGCDHQGRPDFGRHARRTPPHRQRHRRRRALRLAVRRAQRAPRTHDRRTVPARLHLSRGRRTTPMQGSELKDADRALAVLSISGGIGIMMADRAEQLGVRLPPMPADAARRLTDRVPFATATNPIDVTGQALARPEVLTDTLADLARCGTFSHVAAFIGNGAAVPAVWQALQACLDRLQADAEAAALVFSGIVRPEQREWLESRGCLVFQEPADAVDAVVGCWPAPRLRRLLRRRGGRPPSAHEHCGKRLVCHHVAAPSATA
jgi:acyl-CoA synthetase (NDP forming)